MNTPRTFLDKLFLVVKGLCMGAANKVPGVSGGIVAFVGGFLRGIYLFASKDKCKSF